MANEKQLTLFIPFVGRHRATTDELLRFLTRFENDEAIGAFHGATTPCLMAAAALFETTAQVGGPSPALDQPWSIDRCLAPMLNWVKCTAAPATRTNSSRARYLVVVEDLAREAARAGCGGYLAWTAGELLDRGRLSARVGLRIIRLLAANDPDDATSAVIALLPDLHQDLSSRLPSLSARLRPQCVVTVATVLRRAEAAMRETETLTAWRIPAACDDLRYWTREESSLLRLISLGGLKLVFEHASRVVQKKNAAAAVDFVGILMNWLTEEQTDEHSANAFVVSRLLQPLWLTFPNDASNASATVFERAGESLRLAVLAAAVEALEQRLADQRRSDVPQFEFLEKYVRYAAPQDDPWPKFGEVVARAAADNSRLRLVLQACNERLRMRLINDNTSARQHRLPTE